ncbi:hypothetical protein [Halomicronema hongdechloris]|uniref:hypothetical protein n=1 Tax=Halomicronema hongdechloris TaxID=1209493 RepID=UPI001651807D|nr:hypothetical protein [Halomicronema hongdechloris]
MLKGFPDGEFLPSSGLTYAQFAAMISQAFELTSVRQVTAIQTISQSYWAYQGHS